MPRCATIKMVGNTLPIGCNTGLITGFSHIGVNGFRSEADSRGLCASGVTGDSTGLDCSALSDHNSPLFEKVQECIGKQSCVVTDIHDYIAIGSQTWDPGCTVDERDSLYVQYQCQVPDDDLLTKRTEALQAGAAAIFSCLALLAVIQYRVASISIEKREWDLLTVTASDYTLEIPLKIEQVREMRNKIKLNNFMPYDADGLRLKLWLTKRLEDELKNHYQGTEGFVSNVDFTYHNSWLLDMLREKGDYVKWQEWKKLNVLNREMTRKVHEDMARAENAAVGIENDPEGEDAKVCSLVDPISAFVSMETEEAYNNLAAMGEIRLGDGISTISEACEPTNIIWENYDFDDATRSSRFLMIIGVICFVLFLTFCVTFKAKDATR